MQVEGQLLMKLHWFVICKQIHSSELLLMYSRFVTPSVKLFSLLLQGEFLITSNNSLLNVLQDEPFMKPGLAELPNAVVVPHIASASKVPTIFLHMVMSFWYWKHVCKCSSLNIAVYLSFSGLVKAWLP